MKIIFLFKIFILIHFVQYSLQFKRHEQQNSSLIKYKNKVYDWNCINS